MADFLRLLFSACLPFFDVRYLLLFWFLAILVISIALSAMGYGKFWVPEALIRLAGG